MGKKQTEGQKHHQPKTPMFLLELPSHVDAGLAHHLCAHLEVARPFYNAMLGEARKRLDCMRADPAWQAARSIPRTQKQERSHAFSQMRQHYQFSDYALHAYATRVRKCAWIADHLDLTYKNLHGFLVKSIIRFGNIIQIEKTSFKGSVEALGRTEPPRLKAGVISNY